MNSGQGYMQSFGCDKDALAKSLGAVLNRSVRINGTLTGIALSKEGGMRRKETGQRLWIESKRASIHCNREGSN